MNKGKENKIRRLRRHRRVRAKVRGTADRPRLSVFRSNRHLCVQLIDDAAGRTIAAASDAEAAGGKKETRNARAEKLGALIAKRAAEKAVAKAVFDRGSYRYHGLVSSIAEAARKAGLQF